MGSQVERTRSKVALADSRTWRIADWVVLHSNADKIGRTTGEQDRLHNPEFQRR